MPDYRTPVWRNIWLNVYEKVKTFVFEAGKVIIIISIILWALSTFGPGQQMEQAEELARTEAAAQQLDEPTTEALIASAQLEQSYAGHIGRFMEPAIRPLGYDWKIGIALLTSFAAREVFVGTMATIYSLGDTDDEFRIRARLAAERNPTTGEPVYNPATAWSLLIFYVFALMCMSTLAVTKRETNSWKWPIIQFFFMTGIAYVAAFGVYQWLS
jgi:ferrous iron transport protein B